MFIHICTTLPSILSLSDKGFAGTTYYHLTQADYEDSYRYSSLRSAFVGARHSFTTQPRLVYPNPVSRRWYVGCIYRENSLDRKPYPAGIYDLQANTVVTKIIKR